MKLPKGWEDAALEAADMDMSSNESPPEGWKESDWGETAMSDLISRLRFGFLMHANGSFDQARTNELTDEAADALEAKDKRIAELEVDNLRLTECLKKANAGFEEFERKWYLRGDEIEKLEAERDALKVDAAKQFQSGHAAGLERAAVIAEETIAHETEFGRWWCSPAADAIRAMK